MQSIKWWYAHAVSDAVLAPLPRSAPKTKRMCALALFVGVCVSAAAPQPRRVVVNGQPGDYPEGGSGGGRVRPPAPWKSDAPVTQAKLDLDRTVHGCVAAFPRCQLNEWCRFNATMSVLVACRPSGTRRPRCRATRAYGRRSVSPAKPCSHLITNYLIQSWRYVCALHRLARPGLRGPFSGVSSRRLVLWVLCVPSRRPGTLRPPTAPLRCATTHGGSYTRSRCFVSAAPQTS